MSKMVVRIPIVLEYEDDFPNIDSEVDSERDVEFDRMNKKVGEVFETLEAMFAADDRLSKMGVRLVIGPEPSVMDELVDGWDAFSIE